MICLECSTEFIGKPREMICSNECRITRGIRLRHEKIEDSKVKRNRVNSDAINAVKVKNLKVDYVLGEKVRVSRDRDGKEIGSKTEFSKVIKCYKHHVLCKFKNYKESFDYREVEKA